jgi:hypothetical protein
LWKARIASWLISSIVCAGTRQLVAGNTAPVDGEVLADRQI